MCALASTHGIECGRGLPEQTYLSRCWKIFADALPWLAGKLGTPGMAPIRCREPRRLTERRGGGEAGAG
jgi:hypothetical protein